MTVTTGEPVPGFLKLEKARVVLKASYRAIRLREGSSSRERDLTLIQVIKVTQMAACRRASGFFY